MSECEIELVVGKKYKVRLKPFEELVALGLAEGWDEEHTWYREYLGRDVGLVTVPSQEEWKSVKVHWSNDDRFFYDLRELKILGEV